MKNLERIVFSLFLILLLCSPAISQQAAAPRPRAAGTAPANAGQGEEPKPTPPPTPPLPKPPDEPSLLDTMKFIQDQMSNLPRLDTTLYWTNNRTGRHGQTQGVQEIASFSSDASACQIGYSLVDPDPNSVGYREFSFELKSVSTVRIMTYAELTTEQMHANGFVDTTTWSDPPEFAILVTLANTSDHHEFYFIDQNVANRVGEALTRAVRLCGGGN